MAENTEPGRSEQATPFKKREAMRKGTVRKSADVMALAVVCAGGLGALLHLGAMAQGLLLRARHVFTQVGQSGADPGQMAAYLLRGLASFLLPMAALIFVLVAAVSIWQTGLVFTLVPLKPDFSRLNPVSGAKRLLTSRLWVELLKTLSKVVLFGMVGGLVFWAVAVDLTAPGMLTLGALLAAARGYGMRLILWLALLLLMFALLDFYLATRRHNAQMRMSRREIREEHKRHEGDPTILRRQRELRRELARKTSALAAVKDADFVLTNPHHLAVAIRYRPQELDAPVVVAKGAGQLAARIRNLARQHHVPLLARRSLARRIYFHTRIGHAIDPQYYPEVARLMYRAGLLGGPRGR